MQTKKCRTFLIGDGCGSWVERIKETNSLCQSNHLKIFPNLISLSNSNTLPLSIKLIVIDHAIIHHFHLHRGSCQQRPRRWLTGQGDSRGHILESSGIWSKPSAKMLDQRSGLRHRHWVHISPRKAHGSRLQFNRRSSSHQGLRRLERQHSIPRQQACKCIPMT